MSAAPAAAVITGVGAVTSVGLTAPQTAAAVRAGISRLAELADRYDGMGEPVVGAAVPWRCPEAQDRLTHLLLRAAAEALDGAGLVPQARKPRVALLLATPDGPRLEHPSLAHVPDWPVLEKALAERVVVTHKERVPGGHAAALLALARAGQLLEAEAEAVLIGAVDSLITMPVLQWLQGQERLKAAYAPKGFIPGEAAGFLVVRREPGGARPGARRLVRCHGVASAKEPVGPDSEQPCLGEGLTEALQGALDRAGVGPQDLAAVLCDLNGEPYRANEWCLARNRVLAGTGDLALWHPAHALGDIGAASGAVLAALACVGLFRGYWRGRRVLLWTASDAGQRAAVCLEQADHSSAGPG